MSDNTDYRDVDGFECYEAEYIRKYSRACKTEVFYVWAYGAPDEVYPSFLGADRGARLRGRYVMVEMHYDNPQTLDGIVDSSGVDLQLTTRKREHESGQIFISPDTAWNIVVPPKQVEELVYFYEFLWFFL